MIRDIVGKILPSVSEAQMMDTVRLVSGFHRLQASEGYRDAARAVAARAEDYGIRARVEELGLAVDPYVFEEMPWLLHGPTAAAALARAFPCLPRDVVQAIARHTAGAVGMTDLDMVVYVADALEPGRDYAGLDEIRALAGRVPLEELYLATFRHVFLNLVERRKRIHPQSIEIWNYYLARSHDAADERKGRKGTA